MKPHYFPLAARLFEIEIASIVEVKQMYELMSDHFNERNAGPILPGDIFTFARALMFADPAYSVEMDFHQRERMYSDLMFASIWVAMGLRHWSGLVHEDPMDGMDVQDVLVSLEAVVDTLKFKSRPYNWESPEAKIIVDRIKVVLEDIGTSHEKIPKLLTSKLVHDAVMLNVVQAYGYLPGHLYSDSGGSLWARISK